MYKQIFNVQFSMSNEEIQSVSISSMSEEEEDHETVKVDEKKAEGDEGGSNINNESNVQANKAVEIGESNTKAVVSTCNTIDIDVTLKPNVNEVQRINDLIKNRRILRFTATYLWIVLYGDDIVTYEQFATVTKFIARTAENVAYALISKPTIVNGIKRQLLVLLLKRQREFKAVPQINHDDGTRQNFWYQNCWRYCNEKTGIPACFIKPIK